MSRRTSTSPGSRRYWWWWRRPRRPIRTRDRAGRPPRPWGAGVSGGRGAGRARPAVWQFSAGAVQGKTAGGVAVPDSGGPQGSVPDPYRRPRDRIDRAPNFTANCPPAAACDPGQLGAGGPAAGRVQQRRPAGVSAVPRGRALSRCARDCRAPGGLGGCATRRAPGPRRAREERAGRNGVGRDETPPRGLAAGGPPLRPQVAPSPAPFARLHPPGSSAWLKSR